MSLKNLRCIWELLTMRCIPRFSLVDTPLLPFTRLRLRTPVEGFRVAPCTSDRASVTPFGKLACAPVGAWCLECWTRGPVEFPLDRRIDRGGLCQCRDPILQYIYTCMCMYIYIYISVCVCEACYLCNLILWMLHVQRVYQNVPNMLYDCNPKNTLGMNTSSMQSIETFQPLCCLQFGASKAAAQSSDGNPAGICRTRCGQSL